MYLDDDTKIIIFKVIMLLAGVVLGRKRGWLVGLIYIFFIYYHIHDGGFCDGGYILAEAFRLPLFLFSCCQFYHRLTVSS